jgi:hypothetical protein
MEAKYRALDTFLIALILGYLEYFVASKISYIVYGLFLNLWEFFLGVMVCYLFWIGRRICNNNNIADAEIVLENDRPIDNIEMNDPLKRKNFINGLYMILNKIRLKDSIVLGVFGKWGSGKSSVLRSLKKKMQQESELLIIDFNPWFFKDDESLISSFLSQLMNAIVEDKYSLNGIGFKSKIKSYINKLGTIQYKSDVLMYSLNELVKLAFKNGDTVTELKKDIDEMLINNNRRIIVFIDDIDRLNRSEMESIFSLVKLIADFPNVCYILAFDEDMVKAQGFNDEFLEKIIQVPLHIPQVKYEIVADEIINKIEDLLGKYKVALGESDRRRLDEFWKHLNKFNLTFRNAKKFYNIIVFSIPILQSNVNIVDLVIVEFIRVFFPSAYKAIIINRIYFLRNRQEKDQSYDGNTRDGLKQKFIESVGNETFAKIEHLLYELFPGNIFTDNLIHETEVYEWGTNKRICSETFFDNYFEYVDSKMPEDDLVSFLGDLIQSSNNYQSLEIKFSTLIKKDGLEIFLQRVIFCKELNDFTYIMALTRFIIGFYLKEDNKVIESFIKMQLFFFRPLLRRLLVEQRIVYSEEIVKFSVSIEFALQYIKYIGYDLRQDNGTLFFEQDKLNELYSKLAERITIDALSRKDKISRDFIVVWFKYGDKKKFSEYLLLFIDDDYFEAIVGFIDEWGNSTFDPNIWSEVLIGKLKEKYPPDSIENKKNFNEQNIRRIIKLYDEFHEIKGYVEPDYEDIPI